MNDAKSYEVDEYTKVCLGLKETCPCCQAIDVSFHLGADFAQQSLGIEIHDMQMAYDIGKTLCDWAIASGEAKEK